MKIDVTHEQIRDGEVRVPNKSAVALALREAFPKHKLMVYSDAFEEITTGRRYELPEIARLFFVTDPIKRKPFAFDLDDHPESAREPREWSLIVNRVGAVVGGSKNRDAIDSSELGSDEIVRVREVLEDSK